MSAALFEITRNATILNTVLEELRHWDPNEPSHTTVAGMQQRWVGVSDYTHIKAGKNRMRHIRNPLTGKGEQERGNRGENALV
jgi:hypothetical protein